MRYIVPFVIFASSVFAFKPFSVTKEIAEYALYSENGSGFMQYFLDTVTFRGKPAYRLIAISGLSNIEKRLVVRDSTVLYVDENTLRPIYGSKKVRGTVMKLSYEVEYDTLIHLNWERRGIKIDTTFSMSDDLYDNLELFYLVRMIPLEEDEEVEFTLFYPSYMVKTRTKAKVMGLTKTTFDEGDTVEAYQIRVETRFSRGDYYVEAKPPHRIIQYNDHRSKSKLILRKIPTGTVPE
jgi:hypothetical protein